MFRPRKNQFLIAGVLAISPFLAGHADDMVEGERLYKIGKPGEAAAYFTRALETNAYNASAHYFLGNCLVAQKRFVEARSEYKQAMEETDDKKMESYCRNAIDRLQAYTSPTRSTTQLPKVENTTGITGADAKAERVRAILAQSKLDAKVVIDRAEERCRPIMNDERDAMAVMNIRSRGRSGSIETTSADEREEAKKEFEQRITAIKKDAKTQAQNILDQARRDASSIGRGLPNLDELLEVK